MLYIIFTAVMIIAGVTLFVTLMRNKSIRQGERVAQEMVDNEGKKAEETELAHDQDQHHDARRAREDSEQPPRTPPTPPPVPPVPPMPPMP